MAAPPSNALVRRLCQTAAADRLADLSDADLLDRFRIGGDPAAFEAIVRRHGPLVLAACRRVLADEADVEDAFQASFLVLLQNPRLVRREASVGGWLFGVARRVALQARAAAVRRRAREQKATAPAAAPADDLGWREACDALHREIARLPTRYRRAIWLCYFEGRTRDEAAAALGCSPGAVKGHLERGRVMLRARLANRGIALPAGLLFATLGNTVAALPPRLVQLAVGAATDPPAALTALTRGIAMTGFRARWPALAACLAGLLGLAAALPGPAADPPAAKPADPPAPVAKADPATPSELRTITGTVTGPDAKPVPCARVYLLWGSGDGKPVAETGVAADGSFRLTFDPERAARWIGTDESWRTAELVAVADGFGPAWVRAGEVTQSPWEARLVTDGVPIEGTIRNLEGRPVAGVEIAVNFLRDWEKPEHLDEFLREIPTGKSRYVRSRYLGGVPGRPSTWKTDARGRFTITGLGRDRLVVLKVGGAGVAWTNLSVLTRPGTPIEGKEYPSPRAPALVIFPATFDVPLPPGHPVRGVVRDDATGKPVPGVRIGATNDTPTATTDADGRFEIAGVRKAEQLRLNATPGPAAAGYLGAAVAVPGGDPGLGATVADIRLRRGIPIRAKVVEKGTGRSVEAEVRYLVLYPNDGLPRDLFDTRATLHRQPDGTYTGAALPGPGAVVVRRLPKRYVPADADQKAFFKLDRMPNTVYGGSENDLWVAGINGIAPMPLPVRQYQAVALINPGKGAAGVDLTLELDPGETKVLRLVDPDGSPLAGVKWKEAQEESWSDPLTGAERSVSGVGRGLTRLQILRHEGKQLAAVVTVRPDTPTPLTVTLRPWATVTGKLANGDPRLFADMVLYGLPDYAVTDKDGRFTIEKLPPDYRFEVWVGRDTLRLAHFADPVTARPGERLDLGEVKLKARKE